MQHPEGHDVGLKTLTGKQTEYAKTLSDYNVQKTKHIASCVALAKRHATRDVEASDNIDKVEDRCADREDFAEELKTLASATEDLPSSREGEKGIIGDLINDCSPQATAESGICPIHQGRSRAL